ncbi:MAG: DEAD/DEAH box helicase [Solirubrobacteraceae bacterium]
MTALEIHAILVPGVREQSRRACAFVAAESLNLLSTMRSRTTDVQPFPTFGSREQYRRVEAGLLFLIAAFDANAVMAVRDVRASDEADLPVAPPDLAVSEWALRQILRLIRLSAPADDPFPASDPGEPVSGANEWEVRIDIWRRLGEGLREHLRWLRLDDAAESSGTVAEFARLSELLETEGGGPFADQAHLLRLVRLACDGMERRALRRVEPPPDGPDIFVSYLKRRCREKPLLWPSAESYRERCLPGPARSAAVAMPTGSGKSGVAELAVAQALGHGWVLYLAPTRALVAQVRRDLRRALGAEVIVREFLGGAEFTALADETLDPDPGHTVLVMTPEKCSLALRQSPDAFAALSLCVFDECHLIGEPKGRGVLAELVVAQILELAPHTKVLMQSALLANPEDIAAWIEGATGQECAAIRQPWRPTRTLRAVAGFDPDDTSDAAEAATARLESRPSRTHMPFEGPLNLLVNLQGAWATTEPNDYALVRTTLHAPLRVSRDDSEIAVDSRGYVNAATGAVAQELVEAGHRVLAFIPGNKHHNFSVARELVGFGDRRDPDSPIWREVDDRLDIAEHELGTASLLRSLLAKGVAVHTSAMLQQERRASERAYDADIAQVIFATATLAQGLNLPATAVVIGGIKIGFDPDLTPRQRAERQQSQLLNAVGRAGRPYVAARSLAIVLPNNAWTLGPGDAGHDVRAGAAPFLEQEDASSIVRSQLGSVVASARSGDLTLDTLGTEGLTAFAFLPLRADAEDALAILRRSYAMVRRPDPRDDDAEIVANAMTRLGDEILEQGQSGTWLTDVSYASGLSLPQVVALWAQLRSLSQPEIPETILGWGELMIAVLGRLPYNLAREMLRLSDLDGTKMRALTSAASTNKADAWNVMGQLLRGWLIGTSLTDLAELAVRDGAAGNSGRGSGNPLPKMISLSEQLIVFGLTRIAGAIASLVTTAVGEEPELGWTLGASTIRSLELFSLAVRGGCGDESCLAWWRFGFRERRLAHLASRLAPLPSGWGSDDLARSWIQGRRGELLDQDFFDSHRREMSETEVKALTAVAHLESV